MPMMNPRMLVAIAIASSAAFFASCSPHHAEPTTADSEPNGVVVEADSSRGLAEDHYSESVICSYSYDFSAPPVDWSDGACDVEWCETPKISYNNGCDTPGGALSVGFGEDGAVVVRCQIAETGATSIRITFRYSQYSPVKDLAPFWLGFKQSDRELDSCPRDISDQVALNKTWITGELPACFDGGITMPLDDDTHEVYWRWVRHKSKTGQKGALVDDLTIEWLRDE